MFNLVEHKKKIFYSLVIRLKSNTYQKDSNHCFLITIDGQLTVKMIYLQGKPRCLEKFRSVFICVFAESGEQFFSVREDPFKTVGWCAGKRTGGL